MELELKKAIAKKKLEKTDEESIADSKKSINENVSKLNDMMKNDEYSGAQKEPDLKRVNEGYKLGINTPNEYESKPIKSMSGMAKGESSNNIKSLSVNPTPKHMDTPEVDVNEASLKHDIKNYHDLYDNMPGSSSGQQNSKKELEKRIQQYKIKKGL